MRPVPSQCKAMRSTVDVQDQREQQSDGQRDSQRRFYGLLKPCKAKELFIYDNRLYGGFEENFPAMTNSQEVVARCRRQLAAALYQPNAATIPQRKLKKFLGPG
uniref:Uncharacterized protein n=1 Tax=Anopheles atroparvus TaxID=41427 RepID=A0A182IXJ1_ANOAO